MDGGFCPEVGPLGVGEERSEGGRVDPQEGGSQSPEDRLEYRRDGGRGAAGSERCGASDFNLKKILTINF